MILLFLYGNADPERGFSINRKILEKHGNNIEEDTLESVRTVKDLLIQSGGQSGIEVQKDLFQQSSPFDACDCTCTCQHTCH